MNSRVQTALAVARMLDAAERVQVAALLMQELDQELIESPQNMLRSAHNDIEGGEYRSAVAKASGNWEPQDQAGWEGGFAKNH